MFHSVAELISRQRFVGFGPDTPVLDATRAMAEQRIGAVAVVDGDRLLGIFTERDLLNRVVAERLEPATVRLAEVMTTDPVTVDAADCLVTALKAMVIARVRHLPVLDHDRAVGMLAMRDIPTEARVLWTNWNHARHIVPESSTNAGD